MVDKFSVQLSMDAQSSLFAIINSVAIISITDLDGKIIWANQNFQRTSGYSESELLGRKHNILKSGYHDAEFFREMWEKVLSGSIWRNRVCNKNKYGKLYWVDSSVAPIFENDLDGKQKIVGFVSIRFDVTDSVEKSLELERSYKQIALASKMSTVGELAGSVAHEMSNPLSYIMTSLELLLSRLNSNYRLDIDYLKKHLQKSMAMGDRIFRIIQTLKGSVRDSSEDPLCPTKLSKIIDDAVELVKPCLKEKNITLRYVPSDFEKYTVLCRHSELVQVVTNLLKNACDEQDQREESWVQCQVQADGAFLQLSIIDSGNGIPDEIACRIFDPLFTTKAADKGNGLGLAICKKIIEDHGGKILYNSSSKNTRFDINLPQRRH